MAHDDDYGVLSEEQTAPREALDVPCEFICGVAGSGKTYSVVKAVQDDPAFGVLSSTTGISAVNLGAITVHSLLRYSTTEVLRDSFLTGKLTRVLHSLAKKYRWLIVDEVSMADAAQLDFWYLGVQEANRFADVAEPMGIKLVGDFAQLSPVKAKWAFESECWKHFARNTTKLTKVWRQDGGKFLDALNLVRKGEGVAGAEVLTQAGAVWNTALDTEFEGTTILPRNDMVSRYNAIALGRVPGESFKIVSRRWGAQRSEWGQSRRTMEWGVPLEVELKVGAYVMILANAPDFEWVNGDCGWVEAFDVPPPGRGEPFIAIKLVRTKETIYLHRVVREVSFTERPDTWTGDYSIPKNEDDGGYHPRLHYRGRVRRYVTGQVEYFPIRLAYATSCHKSQSLSLDRVQVDYRDHFFSHPGMTYVALSRCRTLEGLRLVGQREVFAKRCNFDPKIKEWL